MTASAPEGFALQVSGLNELVLSLQAAERDLVSNPELMHQVGEVVADEARKRVPVRTGNLRSTITAGYGYDKAVIWAGGVEAPYAGVINYGWPARSIRPQPFLTDALRVKGPAAVTTLREGIKLLLVRHHLA